MKTTLATLIVALLSAITATATPIVTAEAFASTGPAVTENTMVNQNVYVSSATAPSVTQVNFGFRLVAKDEGVPVNGTFIITSVSYRRYFNGVQKVANALGAYNPTGDNSRPDLAVRNVAGNTVSINGTQTSNSTVNGGNRLLLEDHRIVLNGSTAPFLANVGDTHLMVYTVEGTFSGVSFQQTTAQTAVTVMDSPSAPAGFALSNNDRGDTVFTWNDTTGETGYELERSVNGTNWTSVATLASNETTHSQWFRGDASNQFRVRAVNNAGSSPSQIVEMPGVTTMSIVANRLFVSVFSVTGIQLSQVEVSSDLVNWSSAPEGTDITGSPPSQAVSFPGMGSHAQVRLRSRTLP